MKSCDKKTEAAHPISMRLCTRNDLDIYARHDWVKMRLEENKRVGDQQTASHQWLLHSMPKRMIYASLYGDLFSDRTDRKSILDVGGGFSSLSRDLSGKHRYVLLDLLAHDSSDHIKAALRHDSNHLLQNDWGFSDGGESYDIIIANDLFPNVDQRLDRFLQKYLPYCQEMRLSLTWYDQARSYAVKRVDADEILHVIAWNGKQVREVLQKYRSVITNPNFDIFELKQESLFENGRQVCVVGLKGGRPG